MAIHSNADRIIRKHAAAPDTWRKTPRIRLHEYGKCMQVGIAYLPPLLVLVPELPKSTFGASEMAFSSSTAKLGLTL